MLPHVTLPKTELVLLFCTSCQVLFGFEDSMKLLVRSIDRPQYVKYTKLSIEFSAWGLVHS